MKLFDAQSPLWTLVGYGVLGVALSGVLRRTLDDWTPHSMIIFWTILLTVLLIDVVYGRRLGKSTKMLGAAELREDDEMIQQLSARGTRNVYIFSQMFLPISAAVVAIFRPSIELIVYGIIGFAAIQVIIYSFSIRKMLFDK